MANTIATDILNPSAAGNRDTTTNAGVSLNVENVMEIPMRLSVMPGGPQNLRGGFREILYSDPNAAEAQGENSQWQCVRALGKGGMGWITLWKKYDEDNKEIDACAIKQQPFKEDVEQYEGLPKGVSNEAVYQYQLNSLPDGRFTLKLRRYKFYQDDETSRLYLEYCPHMDLNVLRKRYRSWDTYLPELFLWHVFVSLAKAAVMLEEGEQPWQRFDAMDRYPASETSPFSSFLLHLDIKPENVFLDKSPENTNFRADPTSIYPRIKLADYGLATLMGPFQDEPNHPHLLGEAGSSGFQPPEQILFSTEWDNPLNNQRPVTGGGRDPEFCQKTVRESADGYGVRFTAKFNMWAIGKTMRDLYYLHDFEEYEESTFNDFDSEQQETRYRKYGSNMRPATDNPEGPSNYSPLLLDLVGGCMSLDADNRLSAAEALQRANEGLENCVQFVKDGKVGPNHKLVRLAFRGNEINNLPRGEQRFDENIFPIERKRLYEELVNNTYKDIRWGRLKPPYEKWKREIDGDLSLAQNRAIWPTGEGPFRWDGSRVILTSNYEPGEDVSTEEDQDLLDDSDSDDPDQDGDDEDGDDEDGDGGDGGRGADPGTTAAPTTTTAPVLPTAPALPTAPVPPIAPAAAPPVYPAAGRRACRHRCGNKVGCRHGACCKEGL